MKFYRFTHPEDIDKDMEQFTELIEGKITAYSMEKRYIHKNGRWSGLICCHLSSMNGCNRIFNWNCDRPQRAEAC